MLLCQMPALFVFTEHTQTFQSDWKVTNSYKIERLVSETGKWSFLGVMLENNLTSKNMTFLRNFRREKHAF